VRYLAFSVRAEEVEKILNESKRIVTKIHLEFQSILRELEGKRLSNRDYVNRVKDVVESLGQLKDGSYQVLENFEKVRCGLALCLAEVSKLRKALDRPIREVRRAEDEKQKLTEARLSAGKTEQEIERAMQGMHDHLTQMSIPGGRSETLEKLLELEQRLRELQRKLEDARKRIENEKKKPQERGKKPKQNKGQNDRTE
jgi:hypothetical protein